MDLYKKWVRPAGKNVEVGEILVLEQYLCTLAPEMQVWVKEHNPTTDQKTAELVEAFLAARPGAKVFQSLHAPTHHRLDTRHPLYMPSM